MKRATKDLPFWPGVALALGMSVGHGAEWDEACDPARGKQIAQKCTTCHSFEAGAGQGAGPNLYRVIGRQVGQVEGFKFSSALRNSGDYWSVERLEEFLKDPYQVYPGSRMAFAGLKKTEDRKDLICYMNSIWDDAAP